PLAPVQVETSGAPSAAPTPSATPPAPSPAPPASSAPAAPVAPTNPAPLTAPAPPAAPTNPAPPATTTASPGTAAQSATQTATLTAGGRPSATGGYRPPFVTWDLNLEGGYGKNFPDSRALGLFRTRAGILFGRDPMFYALGLTYDWSNRVPAAFGIQAEA